MLKIQLCFKRINYILRGDTAGKTVFYAPVKFEIMCFLAFHKLFF